MDEHEFDQKIRESALRHESRIEKPLWNKEGVWNRIDSGLEKKNRSVGWKAAAVILILLSAGWSFATWNNFRQYKHDKEIELSKLKQLLDQDIANQNDKLIEDQIVILNQNKDIDRLKKQILEINGISRKMMFQEPTSVKNRIAENREESTNQENLIDSLKNQLRLEKKILENIELTRLTEEKTSAKPEPTVVSKEVSPESRIYYISSHDQPQKLTKGRGFKIGILGLSENKNIEYQSDHSIFKN